MGRHGLTTIVYIGSPVFFASLASAVILWYRTDPALKMCLIGALSGSSIILSVTRWFNCRDDRRHDKLPPDDP